MSDFLVNLARRSAGLAPVVRARSTPAALGGEDSSPGMDLQGQVVSRGGAEVVPSSAAPASQRDVGVDAAPTISPAPLARGISHVAAPAVQRASTASAAAVASPAPPAVRGGDAPVVAPRAAPRPAEPATVIIPASAAVASAPSSVQDDAPRAREHGDALHTIETRTETIVRAESSDATAPVVVTIEPAERAATAAPDTRMEPVTERTVHVRIGAIEIVGGDAAPRPPAVAAPVAAAESAVPASPSGGFDEYAALRSYAPWTW